MTDRTIHLFTNFTPNTWKLDLLFDELGIKVDKVTNIDIFKGEQFEPEFLKISPNNKIPAVLVKENDKEIPIFESGAIMLYFAEKEKKLLGSTEIDRIEALKWLFWQVGGFGPMLGQANHFVKFTKEKHPYSIERYTKEGERLFKVLDTQLEGKKYVIGDELTIADLAIWPWVLSVKWNEIDISKFENVKKWKSTLEERDSFKSVLDKIKEKFQ
jgi:GSH-dependent disulfide-bond oxidoreductase